MRMQTLLKIITCSLKFFQDSQAKRLSLMHLANKNLLVEWRISNRWLFSLELNNNISEFKKEAITI